MAKRKVKEQKKYDGFSDFLLNASPEEKIKVFTEVAHKANQEQSLTANKFVINEVHDIDGDGEFNLKDVAKQLKENHHNEWTPLEGDGDFRSDECISLLKQSDIVVTLSELCYRA